MGGNILKKDEEINRNHRNKLKEIIQQKAIKSVYQPIVSLKDGSIYGYEALSRIDLDECCLNIGEIFELAEKCEMLLDLEKLCNEISLQCATNKPSNAKLFLNVDPNILANKEFKDRLSNNYLKKYNLSSNDIIFETTERTAIEDINSFELALNHYRKEGFNIAVDDVGSAYSSIGRVCSITPKFIKIDMAIVRDIHKNQYKKSLLGALSRFATDVGAFIIAEGVESNEELETLINLGVDYAQGFYWSRPEYNFCELEKCHVEEIKFFNKKHLNNSYNNFIREAKAFLNLLNDNINN